MNYYATSYIGIALVVTGSFIGIQSAQAGSMVSSNQTTAPAMRLQNAPNPMPLESQLPSNEHCTTVFDACRNDHYNRMVEQETKAGKSLTQNDLDRISVTAQEECRSDYDICVGFDKNILPNSSLDNNPITAM